MTGRDILTTWRMRMKDHSTVSQGQKDTPSYWTLDPETLESQANIHNVLFGTGVSLYRSLLPALEEAEHEVILVTCFWACSRTLDLLNTSLRKLSAKAQRLGRRIRVRICFSSSSIFQKLFHTTSLRGKVYPSSQWVAKFALPDRSELSGLDLEIKSIFVLPFSVMHPKFVMIDRKHVFLPSCNVSWEDWFEGMVELSGPIVPQFTRFWLSFWVTTEQDRLFQPTESQTSSKQSNNDLLLCGSGNDVQSVQSVFLPSPHHVNPRFAIFGRCPPPPPTPLNEFVLTSFAGAKRSIFIQTPNLTAPPVLSALLNAIKRGVTVNIVTSERLMILEQLVTAGTTTSRCMKKLVRRHRKLPGPHVNDLEAGNLVRPGDLTISYWKLGPAKNSSNPEPNQSHLKLTVIDEEIAVFGSGNMDRASWFTSQELGVAFFSVDLAIKVRALLAISSGASTRVLYDSHTKR